MNCNEIPQFIGNLKDRPLISPQRMTLLVKIILKILEKRFFTLINVSAFS